jgi:hypothetical protein
MVFFQTRNLHLGKICRVLQWNMLVYFMAICTILQPFSILYCHCVHFVVLWYNISRFWYVVPQNLAYLMLCFPPKILTPWLDSNQLMFIGMCTWIQTSQSLTLQWLYCLQASCVRAAVSARETAWLHNNNVIRKYHNLVEPYLNVRLLTKMKNTAETENVYTCYNFFLYM